MSSQDAKRILIANIGSTSFKYRLFDMSGPAVLAHGRIERIGQALKQIQNLAIAGNFYKGIGVPDCVRTGKEAAQQMANLARHGSGRDVITA